MHFAFILSAPAPHGNNPENNRHNTYDKHDQLDGVKIIIDKRHCISCYFQVLGVKGRYPLDQHIAVGDSQHKPEYADDDSGKDPSSHQIDHSEGHKDHKGIVKKYQRRSHHIIPGLKGRMP